MSLLLAILAFCSSDLSFGQSDCQFDRSAQAKTIQELGIRNPGGAIDLKGQKISWRLRSGAEVIVAHGGCHDLGTSVIYYSPPKEKLTLQEAIQKSIEVISKYLSASDAKRVKQFLAGNKFKPEKLKDGSLEFILGDNNNSEFPLGFYFSLTPEKIKIAWTEG
ncbi:MAG: hypothetical protein ACREPT_04000 [Rudaea sp.]